MIRVVVLSVGLVMLPALPASADPTPSPAAPPNVATACINVLGHNPQTQGDPTQALPAQVNFLQVGQAFCGI